MLKCWKGAAGLRRDCAFPYQKFMKQAFDYGQKYMNTEILNSEGAWITGTDIISYSLDSDNVYFVIIIPRIIVVTLSCDSVATLLRQLSNF